MVGELSLTNVERSGAKGLGQAGKGTDRFYDTAFNVDYIVNHTAHTRVNLLLKRLDGLPNAKGILFISSSC
jgi:hypothetical protein